MTNDPGGPPATRRDDDLARLRRIADARPDTLDREKALATIARKLAAEQTGPGDAAPHTGNRIDVEMRRRSTWRRPVLLAAASVAALAIVGGGMALAGAFDPAPSQVVLPPDGVVGQSREPSAGGGVRVAPAAEIVERAKRSVNDPGLLMRLDFHAGDDARYSTISTTDGSHIRWLPDATGKEEEYVVSGRHVERTTVYHQYKIWYRVSGDIDEIGVPESRAQIRAMQAMLDAASDPAAGANVQKVGETTLDGRSVIQLSIDLSGLKETWPRAAEIEDWAIAVDLYVDPDTYLPVEWVDHFSPDCGDNPDDPNDCTPREPSVMDFTWLPGDEANSAKLLAHVPADYREMTEQEVFDFFENQPYEEWTPPPGFESDLGDGAGA